MSKRITILGAGESGTGTAVLAQKLGMDLWVSDSGKIGNEYLNVLQDLTIPHEELNHDMERILESDEIVKSPGIPDTAEVIKRINEKGIPVISEIEFAGRHTNARKICITGSNGKTTTSCWTYHILKRGGLDVGLAGNVGNSFARQVAEMDHNYYVIELSSFQLDGMSDFKADIAVIMNITPDHLDRYGYSMERYTKSKFRILQNMGKDDHFIFWWDDPVIREEIKSHDIKAQMHPFGLSSDKNLDAYIDKENIIINYNNLDLKMTIHELALLGQHNSFNSMAAGIAAQILNIRKDVIRECLSDFQGVEHRLEKVFKVHGIDFINDSKATNVNSTWYALESMPESVVWIAGGVDKGNEYESLFELVGKKVKAIVCLGVDNQKIHESFEGMVETIVDVGSMAEAVKSAYYLARENDTVLLSPACASFDLFENYEDRGRQFKKEVRNL
jgi:UDP-N-acetylmuramoylalanine--D-glutamate ligase